MDNPKNAPKNFGSLGSKLLDGKGATTSPAKTTEAEPAKGPLLTYHIDQDLKPQLDRVVFWRGKNSSQREVINEALRQMFANEPNAQRPIPGE